MRSISAAFSDSACSQRCQLGMQVALLGCQGLRCAVSLLQLPLAVLQALLPNVHLRRAARLVRWKCWALSLTSWDGPDLPAWQWQHLN